MKGQLLAGRYRLGETIGRGGMGRVWQAHDEVLHRAVAVKELTAAQFVADSDRGVLLARTRAEARAAARISHPAVVTVHDVLEHDERPWIVMELVVGRSLADAVKGDGPLDPREAARIGLWVLRALRAAHTAGVLHRDVKPGNVLLAEDGRVLLTDFGIAQVEGDTTLTKTGEVVGSVDYLAPERVRGADPGPASDLWALGATLYTAVDGRSPFRRTTPLTTMQAVVTEEPSVPRGADALGPVIMALLRKDPEDRPTAEQAEELLAEAAEGRRPAGVQEYLPTSEHYVPTTQSPTPFPPYRHPEQAGADGGAQPAIPDQHSSPTASTPVTPHRAYPPHTYPQDGYGPGEYPQDGYVHSGYGAGDSGMPPGVTHPQQTAGRGRRRGKVVVGVVLAAALVGGGTAAVVMAMQSDRRSNDAGRPAPVQSGSPGPSKSSTSAPPMGTLPKGWVRVKDEKGFSLPIPKGWKREVNGTQIDYSPDDGKHFVRISVDPSPDYDTAFGHQVDLEKQLQPRLPKYHRLRLNANFYRDQPGSLWGFTWEAAEGDPFPGPRRAVEQTYFSRDGVEYAIYMSSPAADWPTAHRQFETILRGWQP
ncbi:serine/threonine-protein kinase [Streptomyces sp. NPDC058045]|uniref:serine/threonine-protein kinase n=1 Tax=Streptomyces sp. NPDC058045 TaxID=3346311 RepID=UPI0036EA04C0